MTTTNHKPTQEYYAVEDYIDPASVPPMPDLGEPGVDPRERWRRIVLDGLATAYDISDYGRVVNLQGKLLKPNYPGSETGTAWIGIVADGRSKAYRIDKLVLATFGDPPPELGMVPVHRNGDLRDCRLENLTWGSAAEVNRQRSLKSLQAKQAKNKKVQPADVGSSPPKPLRRTSKKKVVKKAPARGTDRLEVLRVYRRGGIVVTVDAQGRSTLSKKVDLSIGEMAALAEIAAAVTEMNQMMWPDQPGRSGH